MKHAIAMIVIATVSAFGVLAVAVTTTAGLSEGVRFAMIFCAAALATAVTVLLATRP